MPLNRPARWLVGFLFWTLIGLFYATKMGMTGGPAPYGDSLKYSLTYWYTWGALTPVIIAVDRRLPATRDAILRRGLMHVPLSFLFTSLYVYGLEAARGLSGPSAFALSPQPLLTAWLDGSFHWYYLIYWLIVGVYAAYDYSKILGDQQLHTVELERLLAESRLNTLRSQLHPHFLFNTLNAVSAHLEHNPRIARRMLEQLGELLRLSLKHAEQQEIPLEQELAFLDRYLALQKVRFEDRLDVEIDVEPETLPCLVPTFVLQPLVENAIKHGIAPRSSRGLVRISAWREKGDLRLRVSDDGPGLPDGWSLETHLGVGLSNTMQRLEHLYGGSGYPFSIGDGVDAGVSVDLRLPLHAISTRPEPEAVSMTEVPNE